MNGIPNTAALAFLATAFPAGSLGRGPALQAFSLAPPPPQDPIVAPERAVLPTARPAAIAAHERPVAARETAAAERPGRTRPAASTDGARPRQAANGEAARARHGPRTGAAEDDTKAPPDEPANASADASDAAPVTTVASGQAAPADGKALPPWLPWVAAAPMRALPADVARAPVTGRPAPGPAMPPAGIDPSASPPGSRPAGQSAADESGSGPLAPAPKLPEQILAILAGRQDGAAGPARYPAPTPIPLPATDTSALAPQTAPAPAIATGVDAATPASRLATPVRLDAAGAEPNRNESPPEPRVPAAGHGTAPTVTAGPAAIAMAATDIPAPATRPAFALELPLPDAAPARDSKTEPVADLRGLLAPPPTPAAIQSPKNAGLLNLHAPVGSEQWQQALGEKVQWLADRDFTQAQIKLNPPQLGPIEVRVQVNGDQATVSFTAHSHLTRDALEQAAPRLREMLGANGFGSVDVNVAQHSFSERPQHQQAAVHYEPLKDWRIAQNTPPAADAVPGLRVARSRLDAYA